MIAVIAGGVGAARLLGGLVQVVPAEELTAVVNVADDFTLHGLRICPDIDTVRSTLAGDVGPHGWGRANETWIAMKELESIAESAPAGSRATNWFSLGDRDLAVHLYRTQRLAEGAGLAAVTRELSEAQQVGVRLIPSSEDLIATQVELATGEWVDFQHYFVGLQNAVPIRSVHFDGIEDARPAPGVLEALEAAEAIVIAPSNPFVSVAPIIQIPGIADALRKRRSDTVAVSPIVGGNAIKGPAARMFRELGSEPSAIAVADLWRDFCSRFVIDESDSSSASEIGAMDLDVIVTNTIMSNPQASRGLATHVLGR